MAKQIQLAIAPIAWTNDDMPELGSENTFEQCVSEMALVQRYGDWQQVSKKIHRF